MMRRMRANIWVRAILLTSVAGAPVLATPSPCESFKWDLSREHALFLGGVSALDAGSSAALAPFIVPDRLYELKLVAQKETMFNVEPRHKDSVDGASAGLVYLTVTGSGLYRLSADAPVWLDVIDASGAARAVDFQGQEGCTTPHKVVEFEITTPKVLIQVSGSSAARVKLLVTRHTAVRPTP